VHAAVISLDEVQHYSILWSQISPDCLVLGHLPSKPGLWQELYWQGSLGLQ